MADRSYGKGYLGELGSRLQRFLGFDGEPGASFTSEAVPVILVGDATLPGYGNQQGRRFCITSGTIQAGVDGNFFVRADVDLIIERITADKDAATAALATLNLRLGWAATADPAALTIQGNFLDRSASANDRPQARGAVSAVLPAGMSILRQGTLAQTTWPQYALMENAFLLSAGNCLNLDVNAGNCRFTLLGRTLS